MPKLKMKCVPACTTRLFKHALLSMSLITGVASSTLANAKQADDQLRADCREEGQAVGMQGAELEQFIRDCMAEFVKVKLINVEK